MKPLHLDYQRSYKPFPAVGVVLFICALILGGLTAQRYLETARILGSAEENMVRVERMARKHDVKLGANVHDEARMVREVARANEVLRRMTVPWDGLFQAIEAASPVDVALLSIEPDADKRVLKIVGEAKHLDAMLDYMRNLEATSMFQRVALQSHQIQQQDPEHPVLYTLLADWRDPQ